MFSDGVIISKYNKYKYNNKNWTGFYIVSECIYKPGHDDAVNVICTSSSVMDLFLKEIDWMLVVNVNNHKTAMLQMQKTMDTLKAELNKLRVSSAQAQQ